MMETLKTIVIWALFLGFIGGLLITLWGIIRFAIISPIKTKGARDRLRKPNISGVKALCGFEPSTELVDFYTNCKFTEKMEFSLEDQSQTPSKKWFIGEFFPLTALDVKENLIISRVPGIPIADDMNKGTYFASKDGSIFLSSPNEQQQLLVSTNIQAFSNFVPVEEKYDEDE
jgi:hypothetical protein